MVPFDYDIVCKEIMNTSAIIALENVNFMKESITNIDQSYQAQFFEEFLVYEFDTFYSQSNMNIFSMANSVMAKTIHIISTPRNMINFVQADIDFFLANIANNYVPKMYFVYTALIEDSKYKLSSSATLVLIFVLIISFVGIAGIVPIVRLISSIINKRNEFIEVFLRIEKSGIRDNLYTAKTIIRKYREGKKALGVLSLESRVSKKSNPNCIGGTAQKGESNRI
jgi:hypothetical protein